MSKTFVQAPKPKSQLSGEIIAAFERNGAGQDTQIRVPTNVEGIKSGPQTHIDTKVETLKVTETVKEQPTARLSIDLPKSLHRRFKTACAKSDRKMAEEVITFIEQRTAELEKTG